MPIYEYYCPDNHRIYQFYAKTLAQGATIPKCPDNAAFRMTKVISNFAVTSGGKKDESAAPAVGGNFAEAGGDERMEAAMGAMEKEFSNIDENDPRAMARMMRRMSDLTGEKIDGEMEEVVRKLEEGVDPETLEEQMGGEPPCSMPDPDGEGGPGAAPVDEKRQEAMRRIRARRSAPDRDPKLYDYE